MKRLEDNCDVCQMTEEEAKDVFGVGLQISDKTGGKYCLECLDANDPEMAEKIRAGG